MLSRAGASGAPSRRPDGGGLRGAARRALRAPGRGSASPWLVSDNLIQNFPLRVLVGIDLRHGHAPVWDPYLWSGVPAAGRVQRRRRLPHHGPLQPSCPGPSPGSSTRRLVQVVAALGMVVLLRVLGRSWTASGLGAVGVLLRRLHGGPERAHRRRPGGRLAAVGVRGARPAGPSVRRAARPAPWVGMLGASIGLMGLSGCGRAHPRRRGRARPLRAVAVLAHTVTTGVASSLGVAVGVVLGLALAGAQLVPGAPHPGAVATGRARLPVLHVGLDEQVADRARARPVAARRERHVPAALLRHLQPSRGVELRRHPAPSWACVGLLARRHRRRARGGPSGGSGTPSSALGLVLTWGGFTPLGHVFFHLPLFNRQRLLARNLLEVDLAVAVLFATWVDHMFLSPSPPLVGATPATSAPTVVPARGTPVPPRRAGGGAVAGHRGVAVRHRSAARPPVGGHRAADRPPRRRAPGSPISCTCRATVTRSSLWPLIAFLTVPSAIAAWAHVARAPSPAPRPG